MTHILQCGGGGSCYLRHKDALRTKNYIRLTPSFVNISHFQAEYLPKNDFNKLIY